LAAAYLASAPSGRPAVRSPARGLARRRGGGNSSRAFGPRPYPLAWTFAQVSLSVSVRLKTSCPGRESTSGQK